SHLKGGAGRSLFSIHTDVVDEHLLWKLSGVIRRARPCATYGHIQKDKEWMIKHPGAAGGPLGRSEGGVEIRVDIKADYSRFPLDGIEMKIGSKSLADRKAERGAGIARFAGICGIAACGAVQGAMNCTRLLADVFHNVDLAALRPIDLVDVVAQH